MKDLCIDISSWQKGINYQDIKNNCNYIVIRAGFGDSDIDSQFENHYNNLQGKHLGAYWYSYATTCDDARNEARKCLEIINGKKFDLPIFLDIEDPSMSGLPRDTLDNIVRTFGYEIQKAGYYFAVYSNLNWYRNILSGSELNKEFEWWIALWGDNPPDTSYGINYGIWQFGSTWIGGQNVDGNYIYKDYPTIIRELGLNHLDPEPTPPTPPTPPSPNKVSEYQQWLNNEYGFSLVVDGIYGWDTNLKGVMALQIEYNKQLGAGLVVDGIFGTATKNASPILTIGVSGNITKNLQYMLEINGYSVGGYGCDGIYGISTSNAVADYQRDNGLVVDGLCGPETFNSIY